MILLNCKFHIFPCRKNNSFVFLTIFSFSVFFLKLRCLFGRAITGLGSPRIINRRYIADTTTFSIRTTATAAFGMVSVKCLYDGCMIAYPIAQYILLLLTSHVQVTGLGAALGPGTAILLDFAHVDVDLPIYGKFYFNGMTGPGYLMSILWFIYVIVILFTFEDPTVRVSATKILFLYYL